MTEVEHRELDARVACEVMGWDVRYFDGEELFLQPDGTFRTGKGEIASPTLEPVIWCKHDETEELLPPFSTDLNAAELVLFRIEKLQRRGAFAHELRKLIGVSDAYDSLSFLFYRNKAELICRAALKAIKYD